MVRGSTYPGGTGVVHTRVGIEGGTYPGGHRGRYIPGWYRRLHTRVVQEATYPGGVCAGCTYGDKPLKPGITGNNC